MAFVTACPVCKGSSFVEYLSCIDHTVSHETFQLVQCAGCHLIITSPRPDESELGRYYQSDNYISHSTKAKSIIDYVYKTSRLFNLRWKINLVKKYCAPESSTLLDFGCGTGNFLSTATENGFKVSGVEPSDTARHHAQALLGSSVKSALNDVDASFHVITLWHVLEHIPDLNEKMAHLCERLEKNGTMFIAVPNHRSADAAKHKSLWAGYDVPRHLWHFNQTSMAQLLRNHNLKLERTVPMKLDAFYVSMLSNQYRTKTKTLAGIINGFKDGLASNLAAKKTTEYSSLIYVARK